MPILSNVGVHNRKPKTGKMEGRAYSNVGVQEAVVKTDVENHKFISPQKGRMAKRPVRTDISPTVSQDRNVRQISYDTPLPHPQPNPILNQLARINSNVQKQNVLLLTNNAPLLQRDMSMVTDEQISSNVLGIDELDREGILQIAESQELHTLHGEDIYNLPTAEVATLIINNLRRDVLLNSDWLPSSSRIASQRVSDQLRGSSATQQNHLG